MAGHEWSDWFEREELIGQISDLRVQNLQVEREVVQKRTFTRWMNLHLEKCDPPIEIQDLFQDIQDGRILMALLEELSGCKLLHGFKKSSHRIFRLNNIAKVLSFLEERNVKLVSIDAADVADGNSSIILGLIWNIILFFQIKELTGNIRSQFPSCSSLSSIPTSSDSDASFCSTPSEERPSAATAMREHSKAIKKLLQWVQKRTRKYSVAVRDFGKSWTSGLAFLAVIKSIDPSLVDMRKALLRSARENLEDAFRIAHYSLGIPRLLEPEDVTMNTPDEQSIIMYVSQFLEHFPGIEEPEETFQLIERSVSMGRLNYRDFDSDILKNGSYRGRVKERSHMFQRDGGVHPPPKILISSVSEDRGVMSPTSRVAAARSWSSEDFLADPPVVSKDPKKPVCEVLTSSSSNSSHLSSSHSPTGSSLPESATTESVVGDSAISSPDSWVEAEFEAMQDKFHESRSDGSLFDSGTAWDVYRATPVEVTAVDEGFIPSVEDGGPDEPSITESYIDEGIYSLSSLESSQYRVQGNSHKQKEKEEKGNVFNQNKDLVVKEEADQSRSDSTETVSSKQADQNQPGNDKEGNLVNHNKELVIIEEADQSETTEDSGLNQSEKDKALKKRELSFGSCDAELSNSAAEDNLKAGEENQLLITFSTEQEPSGPVDGGLEGNSVEKSSREHREAVDLSQGVEDHKERVNGQSLHTRASSEEAGGETAQENTDSPPENNTENSSNESKILNKISEVLVETHHEPCEELLTSSKDSQENKNSEPPKVSENTSTTNQEGASKTSLGVAIPLISISSESQEQDEDVEGHTEEDGGDQTTPGSGGSTTDPHDVSRVCSGNDDTATPCPTSGVKPLTSELMRDIENDHLDDSDEDKVSRSSSGDTVVATEVDEGRKESLHGDSQETWLINAVEGLDSTHQDQQADTFTDCDPASKQQNTLDSVDSRREAELRGSEPAGGSANTDPVYPEDAVDLIEPMDLFYPDKEEPMLAEAADAEMQSWPSVLSVSALQPAPASPADDRPPPSLEPDPEGSVPQPEKVITETDSVSESQDQCWLTPISAPVRNDAVSFGGLNEGPNPPVLRHRKGARFTESVDNQKTGSRKADNEDIWWRENWELCLLLLLWLLLYCFWVLPQMDLKMLLNR